jgi:hypothetical protein
VLTGGSGTLRTGEVAPHLFAKGNAVIPRDALFLADPQSPSGTVGGRRWLVAKDVNERGPPQRLGEGKRVPQRLGAFTAARSSSRD